MFWILILSFGVAALATLAVIASSRHHAHWSADNELDGPQKMHAHVVPRVGGLGLALGFVAGGALLGWLQPGVTHLVGGLLLCAAPAFGFGLIEDFTKAVSPRRRLVAAACSAALGVWLLGASIPGTGWPLLDQVLVGWGLLHLLTLFAVAGVVNSVNIIDGMNGLASMCVALMLAALCYAASQVGDTLVAGLCLAALGGVLGFFVFNYPRGLIFLGDGGAYLLGFLVAELGLMLVQRNPAVSPVMPLLLVAYPVFETVFTMYRRKFIQDRPVSQPDGVHLHTLIYRRYMRWAGGGCETTALVRGNSRTSPYLWLLCSLAVLPAALWWDKTPVLLLAMAVFILAYVSVYWRIVRFRAPAWLGGR